MGYEFCGFFTTWVEGLAEAAAARWPLAVVKRIEQPFGGIGVKFPDYRHVNGPDMLTAEDYEQLIVLLDEELPPFSRAFPDATFVGVDADCIGGTCLYDGLVCRNGSMLLVRKPGEDDALQALLAHLGVELDSRGYFEPFRRGYFRQD